MSALPSSQRAAHHALIRHIVSEAATDIREVPDGFVLSFPASEYEEVVRFVAAERLCCPFLRFSLEVSADGGPLALSLVGPPGAAAFVRAELNLPVT
jgi:hypothetical protein